ncbi:amino acid/polyamine transporter I [Pseudomassariella vexata]|uniref:Amino acid/polyamine transporter I n=1 Tax=Pseudomassariella vexata TaxID=1141098 RepID=A0A1Y2EBW9_9PEZI|nr:amino acid/polyamine transporter I [Pseudomassariella vexata]ORY69058.1 amino acid/polyamine transporter I [Pseudomassariella vexata]
MAADSLPVAERRHTSNTVAEADENRLAQFGYKQELKRDWGLAHNFGVSFSIISVITGITTLFSYGLNTGGPAVMSIGWIVVSLFTMTVAIAMAEIVSAIPTSGGPYFWAALLAPPKYSPFAAWLTGWFNLLGQVAVTTGISFGLANLIATAATVKNAGYEATSAKTIGIYAAVLVSHGLVNSFGVHVLRFLNNASIILHSAGVTALCIAVLAQAPTHQPGSFVFGQFYDGTGIDGEGWSVRASTGYVVVCGSLLSQYTLTGFDASAHLSEETKKASWSAPIGVVSSVGFSALFGFFVLMALLFSIQDFDTTLDSEYGQPVLQIFVDVFGEDGALALFSLVMVCVWHCGLFSMTSNSRMMFAFARDGGIHPFFHQVDARFRSPIRAVWLAATLSFILALPSLGSSVAFSAATSIATIGLYISYGLPIAIGLIFHENFTAMKGPFNLGPFSKIVALVAVLWIMCITVVFCLPTSNPVSDQTLNYTVVAVGIIAVGATGAWVLWARKWFTGPATEVSEAMRLSVDPTEPGALEMREKQVAGKEVKNISEPVSE